MELLSIDDHKEYIETKLKMKADRFRPDIVHRSLLSVYDSPLSKAGLTKAYVRTTNGVLIEFNPKMRIPRTEKRFYGLVVQVLSQGVVAAPETDEILMRVVKEDIKEVLGEGCAIIGTSSQARSVDLPSYVDKVSKNGNVAFVVGATSKGQACLELDYLSDCISLSRYPLSSSLAITKIVNQFEIVWDIN